MKTIKLILFLMMFPIIGFAQLEQTRLVLTDGINGSVKQSIEDNVSWLLQTCNEAVMTGKKPDMDGNSITKEARKAVEEMWKTSPMACPVSQIEEICIQTSTGYQVRNIPVTMMAANDSVKDQELVVSLTDQGMIDGVSIAISENKYKEIMSEHESVSDLYRRQVIVDFVENYRTSYNRKDLKYIESVFSDNALIITGKVVTVRNEGDFGGFSQKVEYTKQSKEQYILNLRRAFARNKWIDVKFSEIGDNGEVGGCAGITRSRVNGTMYGVRLRQEWRSSNYSDEGYLFLLWEFPENGDNPIIHVRTWQPEWVGGVQQQPDDDISTLGAFDL